MFRKLVLAATLALGGGLAATAAAPTPASAQGVYIGVGGPGYYRGYDRPRYRPYRPYYRPYYRPRPYGFYDRPRYRPRCRIVRREVWNGYRYVIRSREVCRRW